MTILRPKEVGIAGIAFNLIIVRTDKVRRAKAPPTIGASIHFSSRFARRSTLQADNVHSTMSPSTTNEEVHDEHGTTATASTSRALETKINIDDNVP
ncbi:hypothetical protein H0H87_008433 [Tephrocybe sp. NHM501043]|nr:hypothetical protein H0H87_008433 [Tephrocybe sp. NHM501043]